MGKTSKQLVLDALSGAHELALRSIREPTEWFSSDQRKVLENSIQAFQECLRDQAEGRLHAEDAQRRFTFLIHGNPDKQIAQLLRQYAESLLYLLAQSRDQWRSPGKRKDN